MGVPTRANRAALQRVPMEASGVLFTTKEVERARRYQRPLYIALLVDTTLGLVALSLLVFTRLGSWLLVGESGRQPTLCDLSVDPAPRPSTRETRSTPCLP